MKEYLKITTPIFNESNLDLFYGLLYKDQPLPNDCIVLQEGNNLYGFVTDTELLLSLQKNKKSLNEALSKSPEFFKVSDFTDLEDSHEFVIDTEKDHWSKVLPSTYIGEYSNTNKKKKEALIHNESSEIMKCILPIGVCQCGEELFMYLKSNPQNRFSYYCSGEAYSCGSVGDIRNPKEGDIITNGPTSLLKFLHENYPDLDESVESKQNFSRGNPKPSL